jgi:hypothetical protein
MHFRFLSKWLYSPRELTYLGCSETKPKYLFKVSMWAKNILSVFSFFLGHFRVGFLGGGGESESERGRKRTGVGKSEENNKMTTRQHPASR